MEQAGTRYIEIDYSRQAVWALGVLCCEIALGEYPFGAYPSGYEAFTEHHGGRGGGGGGGGAASFWVSQEEMAGMGMAAEFGALVQRMVDPSPGERPSLEEVVACLMTLRAGCR